jgi:hypothetical protein
MSGKGIPGRIETDRTRSQFTPASGCASSVVAHLAPRRGEREAGGERALNGIDVVRGDLAGPDTFAASLGRVGGVDQAARRPRERREARARSSKPRTSLLRLA